MMDKTELVNRIRKHHFLQFGGPPEERILAKFVNIFDALNDGLERFLARTW